MAKLPQRICVKEVRGIHVKKIRHDGTYLDVAHNEFEAAEDDGSEIVIGVYELKEIKRVKKIVHVR